MKKVILIYQIIQEKIANSELFMLVMIEYILMFRIVKKMQNSGLEIVAGLTPLKTTTLEVCGCNILNCLIVLHETYKD